MGEYDIAKAFDAIERELMTSMIRNLDRHKAEESELGIEWSQWQIEQLKRLERYKIRNRKKYGSQFADINRQIDVLIRTARESGGMEQEIEILKAIRKGFKGAKKSGDALTAQFFRTNDRKIEALIKATTDDMKKAETAILRMADDKYRQLLFNAQVYANTGAGTYEKAVDMATKDMLSAGLNCVEYANGARHTLADYADMAISTACKRKKERVGNFHCNHEQARQSLSQVPAMGREDYDRRRMERWAKIRWELPAHEYSSGSRPVPSTVQGRPHDLL